MISVTLQVTSVRNRFFKYSQHISTARPRWSVNSQTTTFISVTSGPLLAPTRINFCHIIKTLTALGSPAIPPTQLSKPLTEPQWWFLSARRWSSSTFAPPTQTLWNVWIVAANSARAGVAKISTHLRLERSVKHILGENLKTKDGHNWQRQHMCLFRAEILCLPLCYQVSCPQWSDTNKGSIVCSDWYTVNSNILLHVFT